VSPGADSHHTSHSTGPAAPPSDQPRRSWMEQLWAAAQDDPNLPSTTRLVARWIALHMDGLGADEFRVSQKRLAAQLAKQLGRPPSRGEVRRHLLRLEGDARIEHGWQVPPERGPIRCYLRRLATGGGKVKGGNGRATVYVLGPDAVGTRAESLSLGLGASPFGPVETVDAESPRNDSPRVLTTAARSVRIGTRPESPVSGVKTPSTIEGAGRLGGRARAGAPPAHAPDVRARATPPPAEPSGDHRAPGGAPTPANGAEASTTPDADPLAGGAPHVDVDAAVAPPGPGAPVDLRQGGELRKIFAEGRAVIAAAEARRPDVFGPSGRRIRR